MGLSYLSSLLQIVFLPETTFIDLIGAGVAGGGGSGEQQTNET